MSLWGGRFAKDTDQLVKEFSSSIALDAQLWAEDIRGSQAHAQMLVEQRILSAEDGQKIASGLGEIYAEIESGTWSPSSSAEDVHGEIENRLFAKIGEAAKRMHTARSRNDQVATDTRLFLRSRIRLLRASLRALQDELLKQSADHFTTLLPGTTHLQHAQPVSLAHHLLAYFWMFERDLNRLDDSLPRLNASPLGSAALAGTGFPIDRQKTAAALGFTSVIPNSMDAVSDRDFVVEFLASASLVMMHLSRMSEELILWSTPEFGFIELGDEVTTGSSIMPQKKNPDVAELIRGRVGRVYGALMGALTMLKALPLSYNRDLQEDKVHLFSGLQTTLDCVQLMTLMLQKTKWNTERMLASLRGDFSNATDLADDLVEKGVSFRAAHEVVGQLVQKCLEKGQALESLTVQELRSAHSLFDSKSLAKLPHAAVLAARRSEGGAAPEKVREQWDLARKIWSTSDKEL